MKIPVELYASMIEQRRHFAEAAYRDGEWRCILGDAGQTVNGERYTPELARALVHTLMEPVGQWCAYFDRPESVRRRADRWLAEHTPPVEWVPDRVIMQAVVRGAAGPLFAAARTRNVLLVGPQHLRRLPETVLGRTRLIEIPDSTAWKVAGELAERILAVVQPDDLVLFCAGMASNLLIHRLWPTLKGAVTLYDVGAALDPFCGAYSRNAYRSRSWRADVMPRSLA